MEAVKIRTIIIAVLIILVGTLQSKAQNQTLVIEGGTLIDGTGANPVKDAVVVIEGNRFKTVGTKGKVSYPPNAKVINATGKTILPGLIEAHFHFRQEWAAPIFLHFGITTFYDLTNYTGWIVAEREAIKKGVIKGPRLFATGTIIDGPMDYYEGRFRALDLEGLRDHYQTTDQVRAAVREKVAQGVDAIKITEAMSPEQIAAVTDEANKFGLQVCGHATDARVSATAGLKCIAHMPGIVRATITKPESIATVNAIKKKDANVYWRGNFGSYENLMEPATFDSLIQLLVQKGVFLNVTFAKSYSETDVPRALEWAAAGAEFAKNTPGLDFVPQDVRQMWIDHGNPSWFSKAMKQEEFAEGYAKEAEFIRKFSKAGGKIAAGTDRGDIAPYTGLNIYQVPFVPGLSLHQEMQSLVDAGVPPMQVIVSATKTAAEMLHKDKDLGTIEPGKLADLITVNGDPLADITAAKNVSLVVMDGKVVDTTFDPKFKNPLPRPFNVQRHGPSMGPEMARISPERGQMGEQAVTVEVAGSKFTPHSVVRFDTTDLKTHFESESKLTAVIDAGLLKQYGTYPMTVVNPGSGGGTSNVLYFVTGF
jgi:imidazolonepropionase-like amidohydrolase